MTRTYIVLHPRPKTKVIERLYPHMHAHMQDSSNNQKLKITNSLIIG